MRKLLVAVVRLVFYTVLTSALVAAVRAMMERLSEEPGAATISGSYDGWPEVPQAPSRQGQAASG